MVKFTKRTKADLEHDFDYYKKIIEKKTLYIKYIKRGLDIFFTPFLIILASPIMILTAIAIKLTSKGPAILKQERIGYQGKYFKLYKFRSMYINEENPNATHHNPEHLNEKGILVKHRNDPRVTPLGKLIRKTSIDELPQLFNVLKGDMSLIGPRPLLEFFIRPYPKINKIRSLVKPGLTGYWQVKNRANSNSYIHMIDFDLYYLEHISFWLDLQIMLETISSLIKAKGAY